MISLHREGLSMRELARRLDLGLGDHIPNPEGAFQKYMRPKGRVFYIRVRTTTVDSADGRHAHADPGLQGPDPRRPAWEAEPKLEIKNMSSMTAVSGHCEHAKTGIPFQVLHEWTKNGTKNHARNWR